MCLLSRNIRTTTSSREPFICRRKAVRRQIRGFSAFQIICCDTADCTKQHGSNHFTEPRNGLSDNAEEAFQHHGKGFTAVHKSLSDTEKKSIGKNGIAGIGGKYQLYSIKEQRKRWHGMPGRLMLGVLGRSRAHRLQKAGVKIFYCPVLRMCGAAEGAGRRR